MFFADKLGPVSKDAAAIHLYTFLATRLNGRESFPNDELVRLSETFLKASGAAAHKAPEIIEILVKVGKLEKKGGKVFLR